MPYETARKVDGTKYKNTKTKTHNTSENTLNKPTPPCKPQHIHLLPVFTAFDHGRRGIIFSTASTKFTGRNVTQRADTVAIRTVKGIQLMGDNRFTLQTIVVFQTNLTQAHRTHDDVPFGNSFRG